MEQNRTKILIVLRAGAGSIHQSWIWTTNGYADVAISSYDDSNFNSDGATFVHASSGGKFQGLSAFFETHRQLLDEYDYFWLFEDDLFLPFESLRLISDILSKFSFDLAAPALAYYSYFTWPITVRNDRFLLRCTDFVEVMAPLMSRNFLRIALPAFNDNFSAWGHEWLWRKLLIERDTLAAIIDAAPVVHTRPFGRGTLRRNQMAGTQDPKIDRDDMFKKYNLDGSVQFRNFFGVSSRLPHTILTNHEFLQEALSGYSDMQAMENQNFVRCIDTLIRGARPIVPLTELQDKAVFRMVRDNLCELG